MKAKIWTQHKQLISVCTLLVLSVLVLCITTSEWVTWQQIEMSDVVGEGSILVLTLLWSVAVLMSRPPGRVTSYLVIGLSLFTCSSLIDLFDEFTDQISTYSWISLIESIPAAVGMVVMSLALYWWHQEQLALNKQLNRRELDYRWHKEIDPITLLYHAKYFIERAKTHISNDRYTCIAVLDLVSFSSINRQFGMKEGDRMLREVGQVIVMNIRNTDLACRYAGDRFVLLMPNTQLAEAHKLVTQIELSIENIAFKPDNCRTSVFNKLRCIVGELPSRIDIEVALQQLNQDLDSQSDLVA